MLIKLSILSVVLVLSGCSSLRTVGELESLNKTQMQSTRETLHTIDTLLNSAGIYHTSSHADHANRVFGHLKHVNTNNNPETSFNKIKDLGRY